MAAAWTTLATDDSQLGICGESWIAVDELAMQKPASESTLEMGPPVKPEGKPRRRDTGLWGVGT